MPPYRQPSEADFEASPRPVDRRARPEPEDAEITRQLDGPVLGDRCAASSPRSERANVPGLSLSVCMGCLACSGHVLPALGPVDRRAVRRCGEIDIRVATYASSFDSFGVHLRRPLSRWVLGVFDRIRPADGFHRNPALSKCPARRELIFLEALSGRSSPVFRAPEPMDTGDVDGWEYLMLSPLPPHFIRL